MPSLSRPDWHIQEHQELGSSLAQSKKTMLEQYNQKKGNQMKTSTLVPVMVHARVSLHGENKRRNRKGKKRMGLLNFERTKNNAPIKEMSI